MSRAPRVFGILVVSVLGMVDPGHAQLGSAAVPLFLDASVPSTGRGGASTAIFWDDGPNYWANPALLAFHRGVRYEQNDTQLVPDLTDDVFHRTGRWTFGAYGIGIATAGHPIDGMGYQEVQYGTTTLTDPNGVPLGTYEAYEEWGVFGIGVSAGEVLARFAPNIGVHGSPLARYADVAVGFATKEFESHLIPASFGGGDNATANDWGVLVRVTPVNTLDYPESTPSIGRAVPVRVDASFGYSVLNGNDATIQSLDGVHEIARMPRTGWGIHSAVGLPVSMRQAFESSGVGWLSELLDPLLRFGYGHDTHTLEVPATDDDPGSESSEVKNTGWELTVADIFTIRRGNVEDPDGDIFGDTDGWSIGLRYGALGGFRYDEATRPQATGLANVHREGWSVFVDPLECWESWR